MQKSIYQDFGCKSIWNLIWPQMVTMYSVVATGIVAVWTAGHINPDTQASLGMVNQCNFFLMVFIMALSSGATAAISQSLGANRKKLAIRYIATTIFGSCIFGLLLALLGFGRGETPLKLLMVPDAILPQTCTMWDISMYGLPSQHIYAATGVIFRATRLVMPALWIALCVNVVNVILCLGLGLGMFSMPDLGYQGLIVASILSQTLGAFLNVLVLFRAGFFSLKELPSLEWLRLRLPYLFRVAVPAGFASFMWQTGYLLLFVLVASLPNEGVIALAGLTAGLRIESMLFLPAMAVNTSLSVIVGNCLGAGFEEKARKLSFVITLIATAALSFVALLVWPFRADIAAEFSKDIATQNQIISYLTFNLLSTPFSIASTVMGGIMVGAGATKFNLLVYGGCSWCIRLPLGYILGHIYSFSSQGIFCAMLVSQCVQATIMFFIVRYAKWTQYSMRKQTL